MVVASRSNGMEGISTPRWGERIWLRAARSNGTADFHGVACNARIAALARLAAYQERVSCMGSGIEEETPQASLNIGKRNAAKTPSSPRWS